jgi:hypothetical protein
LVSGPSRLNSLQNEPPRSLKEVIVCSAISCKLIKRWEKLAKSDKLRFIAIDLQPFFFGSHRANDLLKLLVICDIKAILSACMKNASSPLSRQGMLCPTHPEVLFTHEGMN